MTNNGTCAMIQTRPSRRWLPWNQMSPAHLGTDSTAITNSRPHTMHTLCVRKKHVSSSVIITWKWIVRLQ